MGSMSPPPVGENRNFDQKSVTSLEVVQTVLSKEFLTKMTLMVTAEVQEVLATVVLDPAC